MKLYPLLSTTLLLQAGLALASTPPELVEKIDNSREGDLATKVAAFYDLSPSAARCGVLETARTVAYKISSGSWHEEKVPGTKTRYEASYLVLKYCFSGSTFVGAYREAKDARVIKASRIGVENAAGAIVPSQPDQIQVLKAVELGSIQAPMN